MNPLNKKCHVCGDRATGFNYGGMSCESCKVFFHRNSFRLNELYCERLGKCAINMLNRKECSKCRLEKCFLIGMRRNKCEESNADRAIERGIEQFLGISTLKRITKTDVTQLAHYVSSIPKNSSLTPINSYENERIFEAKTANCVFPDERECQMVAIVRTKEELYQQVEFSDFYIRKSINFCQNFIVFHNLTQDDQMLLLKPFIFEILSIRFAFMANLEGKFMPMIMDDEGTKTIGFHQDMHTQFINQEIIAPSMQFMTDLHVEMDNDIIIRDLLSAMCLFRSHRTVSCPEFIRYQYFLYSQLLIRHLEHKCHNKKEAHRKYRKLIELIDSMHTYRGFNQRIIGEFDLSKFPPIMLELYEFNSLNSSN